LWKRPAIAKGIAGGEMVGVDAEAPAAASNPASVGVCVAPNLLIAVSLLAARLEFEKTATTTAIR